MAERVALRTIEPVTTLQEFGVHDVLWSGSGHLCVVGTQGTNPQIVFQGAPLQVHRCPEFYTLLYRSQAPLPPETRAGAVELTFPGGVVRAVHPTNLGLAVSDKVVMSNMMRSEESVVLQWLDHHRSLGVDHFVLYDNAAEAVSTLALTCAGRADVTIVRWPYAQGSPKPYSSQITAHNHCLLAASEAAFVGIFDVDEYVNLRRAHTTLREFLDSFGGAVGGVAFKNRFMHNANRVETAGNSFLRLTACEAFTLSGREKLFMRPRLVQSMFIHKILAGAPSTPAPTADAYFNHYFFLNKGSRGRDVTELVDESQCEAAEHLDAHPADALQRTLYVGSCRYQDGHPFKRCFPPRLHSTQEMLHFLQRWPRACDGLTRDELRLVFGDSTHPRVEPAYNAFLRLGATEWMRGVDCVALEVCTRKFGRLRPDDATSPPINAFYAAQCVPGFQAIVQTDAEMQRDLAAICDCLRLKWGVRKVLLIPHVDLPSGTPAAVVPDRRGLRAVLERFAASHSTLSRVECVDTNWLFRCRGITRMQDALHDGFHYAEGGHAQRVASLGVTTALVRLLGDTRTERSAQQSKEHGVCEGAQSTMALAAAAVTLTPRSVAAETRTEERGLRDLFQPRSALAAPTRGLDAPALLRDVPLHTLPYAESHGASATTHSTLAAVFELVVLHAPRTCVIIGSGAGVIPRVLREAQALAHARAGAVGAATTYIIDLGEGFGAMPQSLHDPAADFRRLYPEIVVLKMRSVPDGLAALREHGVTSVDVLWIDGDHSYAGSRADFFAYSPLVNDRGLVFMHDTAPNGANARPPQWCGVHRTLRDIRERGDFDCINFMSAAQHKFGCGLAILQRRRRCAVTADAEEDAGERTSAAAASDSALAARASRSVARAPSPWPYLDSPTFSVRQHSVLHFVEPCSTIVEIGCGSNALCRSLKRKRCILIDPSLTSAESAGITPEAEHRVELLQACARDVSVDALALSEPFALVIFGLDWEPTSPTEQELLRRCTCAVVETTTDLPRNVAFMDALKRSAPCAPAIEFSLRLQYKMTAEDERPGAFPPRCNRIVCVFFPQRDTPQSAAKIA